MPRSFWIKRLLVAFAGAFAVLLVVELGKGHDPTTALQSGATWALVFAALYVLVGYIRYRRNPSCMLPQRDGE